MVTKVTRVKKVPVKQGEEKPVKLKEKKEEVKEKKDVVAMRKKSVKKISALVDDLNTIKINKLQKSFDSLKTTVIFIYVTVFVLLLESASRYI